MSTVRKSLVLGASVAALFVADVAPDAPLGLRLAPAAHAIVGMPLTPMSYAGVARRTTRRVVYTEAAVATTAAAGAAAASAAAAQPKPPPPPPACITAPRSRATTSCTSRRSPEFNRRTPCPIPRFASDACSPSRSPP
jgi:hypothetical protein